MSSNTDTCTLEVLLAALQSPRAYPHPTESVHVVQTHASCVFLTGEYVYKIKKPVRFGFLDYGTLERRQALCQQEVLLNQRLCPEVYLEVVPITWQEGHLRVGGEGAAVEWAVRMRQLREADMLPARLEAGTLEASILDRLARKLAQFHGQAHTDDTIRAYGEPSRIAETIRMTLQTMQEVTENTPLSECYSALGAYFEAFERTQASRLRHRVEQNHIRDCHGDLRAQNLCLDTRFGDGIQVFDCIEFNPSFRYIDTAADIAYLAMDLDLAGQAALRARLLEVYTRESNDQDLALILPFYLTYRAMVRGNIALLAARESEIPAAEREAQQTLAASAYDLARSYASSPPRPDGG